MEVRFKEKRDSVARQRYETIEIEYEKGKLILWANKQVQYNDLIIPKFYRCGYSLSPTKTELWVQVEKDLCIIYISFPRLSDTQAQQLTIFMKENNYGVYTDE